MEQFGAFQVVGLGFPISLLLFAVLFELYFLGQGFGPIFSFLESEVSGGLYHILALVPG